MTTYKCNADVFLRTSRIPQSMLNMINLLLRNKKVKWTTVVKSKIKKVCTENCYKMWISDIKILYVHSYMDICSYKYIINISYVHLTYYKDR